MGGAIVGDGRGPARCLVRRTAGNISQYQWLGQYTSCGKGGICQPLQRSRDRLSRPPGLRARRRRAVGRRPADGPQRPRRRGCDVHARHRVGLRPGGVHHGVVRPGRDGRAGRGQPRRVLRLQAEPRGGPAGDPSQDRRGQGDPDDIRRRAEGRRFDADGSGRRSRSPSLLDHRRRGVRARALRGRHREALRPADGHRVGQGRRRRQALHPAGAAGDREVARARRRAAPLSPEVQVGGAGVAVARSARRSGRARCAS